MLLPEFTTAKSVFPLPSKSPAAMASGMVPEGVSFDPYARELSAFVTWNNATIDVPPPGAGLTTVTAAVIAVPRFGAGIVAISR